MVEKFDEICLDPMLCLSALMITTTDMLSRNSVLPLAMSPVYGDYHYNNNDNIHLFETKVYWLCVSILEKVACRSDLRLAARAVSVFPFSLSPALLSLVLI